MATFNAGEIKRLVVDTLVGKLENDIKAMQANIESTRQAARDAPGRMESRYDSTKAEKSSLANALQGHLSDRRRSYQALKDFKVGDTPSEQVSIGSLVELRAEKAELYMILPAGGGEIIKVDELKSEVVVITHQSPLGKSLLGKKLGDEVEIGRQKFHVVGIH